MINKERMKACDSNQELCVIVSILDEANLGKLNECSPGEYVSEARILLAKRPELHSIEALTSELVSIIRESMGWKIRPIFKQKFRLTAQKIYDTWNNK